MCTLFQNRETEQCWMPCAVFVHPTFVWQVYMYGDSDIAVPNCLRHHVGYGCGFHRGAAALQMGGACLLSWILTKQTHISWYNIIIIIVID